MKPRIRLQCGWFISPSGQFCFSPNLLQRSLQYWPVSLLGRYPIDSHLSGRDLHMLKNPLAGHVVDPFDDLANPIRWRGAPSRSLFFTHSILQYWDKLMPHPIARILQRVIRTVMAEVLSKLCQVFQNLSSRDPEHGSGQDQIGSGIKLSKRLHPANPAKPVPRNNRNRNRFGLVVGRMGCQKITCPMAATGIVQKAVSSLAERRLVSDSRRFLWRFRSYPDLVVRDER